MFRNKKPLKRVLDRPKRVYRKKKYFKTASNLNSAKYNFSTTSLSSSDQNETVGEERISVPTPTAYENETTNIDEATNIDLTENIHNCTQISEELCNRNQFQHNLAEWAVNSNICLVDLSKLLKILIEDGKHKNLPKDARTLLKTPRNIVTRKIDNGSYIHFGINNYLNQFFLHNTINSNTLWLSFSVDGTPVSQSGANSLWPIFGAIHLTSASRKVFEVGLFNGPTKPQSFNNFLFEFVYELKELINNGYKNNYSNKIYFVKLKSIVADAPALAALKLVKSHGGYSACTKCEIRGCYSNISNSVLYTSTNDPLRTDESFRKRLSRTENDDHHISEEHTILEKLPIDMINDFPLDKMHLVDEGAVKKILILLSSKVNRQKLPAKKLININDRLQKCVNFFPMEFQRKPRSLKYVLKMKATEYRNFLLYTGPTVLKNVIPKSTYNHFLTFSLAIRILSSPLNHLKYNEYAKSLLLYFVNLFPKIYGSNYMTYNIHGLIHLAQDVHRHGQLESYSCYAFESRIKRLKAMIHTQNMPLQQCFNRTIEYWKHEAPLNFPVNNEELIKFLQPSECGKKYFRAQFQNFNILADKNSDNCIMLKDKVILRVKFFEMDANGDVTIINGQKFICVKPLNGEKCTLLFDLLTGNFEDHVSKYHLDNNILCKICCLPYDLYGAKYFVSPIIHTL